MHHDNENVIFGSLIGIIANIIAFVCCFFGGKNEITWLCILGIIVLVIGILIVFCDNTNGLINLLAIILVAIVAHFVGVEKLGTVYTWFFAPDATGLFYFTSLLLIPIFLSSIMLLGAINTARN